MITKKELQDYANLKGLNLGNSEKDYLIDMALSSISKNTKYELVFKGGTCLYKFHKLNRFSEDIDFSAASQIDVNSLISHIIIDFEKFGIKAAIHHKKESFNSAIITIRAEGPLFSGNPMTYASLGLDINFKSPAAIDPEFLTYDSKVRKIGRIIPLIGRKESERFVRIEMNVRLRSIFVFQSSHKKPLVRPLLFVHDRISLREGILRLMVTRAGIEKKIFQRLHLCVSVDTQFIFRDRLIIHIRTLPQNVIFVLIIINAGDKIYFFTKESPVKNVFPIHPFGINTALGGKFPKTEKGIVNIAVAVINIDHQISPINILGPGFNIHGQLNKTVFSRSKIFLIGRSAAA